uniref:Uncharacterized protein n=1 Tax=Chromera velia CCMP2878 TaxID=1169474 RepID=A0A0G4G4Q9_9ALVE|eukprot:Cvel_563.t1-p1 / transcript=Cvel_563.t1 / gene=Cvel_563 / organism=Chromera_velia_CCMP2878 / gene_product=hypothetical protein / transcript_product=hypothetical protein / location=Cvel_scaffold17:147012-147461(-) / protein_length=150 / sequence_SO=supercontig / SO=protein_coding / is_pseudo=false
MPGDPPTPVNAAAGANQPSGVASVGLKLPDLNWVNYLPAASKDSKHKDDWKLDFKEWKETFLENAGFILRPQFMPDETDRKWLYRLALLRAFVYHPALRRTVHTLKKTKEEKARLDAISLTILNPKGSEKRKAEEKYLAMKRGERIYSQL